MIASFNNLFFLSGSRMSDSDDVVSGDSSVGEGWQEQQQYLVN